jgi:hypothetical protein
MLIVEQALPAWPLLRVTLINLIPAEAHGEAGSAYMVAGKAHLGPPYISTYHPFHVAYPAGDR